MMTMTIKVAAPGETPNIVLPQAELDRLGLKVGDDLQLEANGRAQSFELRPLQSELDRQLAIAERVMAEDEPALRKLAE